MDDKIVCLATFTANPGKGLELQQALTNLVEPTRLESGCLRYILNQHIDNLDTFTMVESFKSKADFDIHLEKPYLVNFKDNILPKLVEPENICIRFFKEII